MKKSFFRCRRFIDEADMHRQLLLWLAKVNGERESRATGERPKARMESESAEHVKLRPHKLRRDALVLRYPVHVGLDAKVVFDGRRYSIAPNAVGQSGTLFLCVNTVRTVASRWEATHRRLRGNERESMLPAHRIPPPA